MIMLLSDNNLATIQTALDSRLEIEMTRSLGDLRLKVSTSRAPPVWRPWIMLARVEIWTGHTYSTQWCVSCEEVRMACKSGSASASGQGRW